MKILVIEDQSELIKNKFDTINLLEYDDKLNIEYAHTSQEAGKANVISKYDLIIIDIDLSENSKKDGIAIIKDLEVYNKDSINKVVVLTGSTLVQDSLNDKGFSTIPVLKKPMSMEEMIKLMKKILK